MTDPTLATKACNRCFEPIALNAQLCKHCGHEQRALLYWIKQIGMPISLFATITSVGISTAAFIKASSAHLPKPAVILTSFRKDSDQSLQLQFFNFGDAPARIASMSVDHRFEYSSNAYDEYTANFTAESSTTVFPNQTVEITFDVSNFGNRASWQGDLGHWLLPDSIRRGDRETFDFISVNCDLVLYAEFGSSFLELDGVSSGLCHHILSIATEYFSENPDLVYYRPSGGI